jgi:hypothetical protein
LGTQRQKVRAVFAANATGAQQLEVGLYRHIFECFGEPVRDTNRLKAAILRCLSVCSLPRGTP